VVTGTGDDVSADFVFGTLATDDLRLAQIRAAAAGVDHAHDLTPRDPDPGQPIVIRVRLGAAVDADHVTAYVTTDGADPAGGMGIARAGIAVELARVDVTWDTLSWTYRETWQGTIPGQPDGTMLRYRIEAWNATTGASTWATEIAGVVAGARPPGVTDVDARQFAFAVDLWPLRRTAGFAVHVDRERVPEWLRDAVIYQVFVDRFATTGGVPFARPAAPSGSYGGTLRGVIERLDHIAELGATCIWLTPIFPSPSHHGYDTTDYRAIEPRLGTEADLRELLERAHARGLRVILDLVVNHCSSAHPAFRAALADRDAPEARWFTFTRWPDEYLSFFGVRDHPQLDTDDPGAREHLIESARHWLRLGVDGFRCDYANGPSHAFWSAFRAATRTVAPASVTIGEVVETPALQATYAGRLDGCLDFVLQQALRQTFGFGTLPVSGLDAFLRRHLAFAPSDFVWPSFLDNHDMNRFLWVVRGDTRRLLLAALCQFTLPHPPVVYYGTEVGLSQERDVRRPDGSGHPEESRLPMPWGDAQDTALLDAYRRLIALRTSDPALWRGERRTLVANDATGVLASRCTATDGEPTRSALVVLHTGDGVARVAIPGPERHLAFATADDVVLDGDALRLPPFGGAVLTVGAR
jgi:glycosidase